MNSHGMPQFGVEPGVLALNLLVVGCVIAVMVFWIVELVDCLRREFKDPTEKVVWVLVIILMHLVGAIIYWSMRKSRGTLPGDIAAAPPPSAPPAE